MVGEPEPGLRERKRLATRRAIQIATLQLLDERGLDGVTVDEISRRADISPRTFFNYFGSKEQALLGDAPELPEGPIAEAFVAADGPLLDDLAVVMVVAGENALADVELARLRHTVLKGTPHLIGQRMATMRRFEDQLAELVARRLRRQEPGTDDAALRHRARLVTLVAFAAMRHAWTSWADGEPVQRLGDLLHESFVEVRELLATGTADIR